MDLRSRFAAVSIAAALAAAGSLLSSPAMAEGTVTACHWINGEYFDTYTCDDPTDAVTSVDIVDCWALPVSPRSFARIRTADGWVPAPEVTVKVRESEKCAEGYPYRTVVTIPGTMLAEMVPTRVQLVMPRSANAKRATVIYAACLMPEDAVDWCPKR
jgi:hypothetical protein